jgi:sulfate transport system permease protein
VLAAFRVSFLTAFIAAAINALFGLITAWILVRCDFPGRRIVDALIDLPFALPTAVAGIALTALYAGNGWLGQFLEPLGIRIAFTPLGIVVALIVIGLPFVVRTVEPVLQDLDGEVEGAAATLGARPFQTFRRVILPAILPALTTGFALAFARGLGEYGSVIFIAGNMPMVSKIVPLLIVIELEQYDYAGATVVGTAMLAASFLILLLINLLQRWARRRAV